MPTYRISAQHNESGLGASYHIHFVQDVKNKKEAEQQFKDGQKGKMWPARIYSTTLWRRKKLVY